MDDVEETTTTRRTRPTHRARHDCVTCVTRQRKCDRARPRCNNCQRSGNVCEGFALQLSWQPGFSLRKKPVKKSIARRPSWQVSKPARKEVEKGDQTTSLPIKGIDESARPDDRAAQQGASPACFALTIPPQVLYNGHFDRLRPIFERYNEEFSLIPLTLSLNTNPFRPRMETLQTSEFLLHAVLALSCHHIDVSPSPSPSRGRTVLDHGQTALQLFRKSLGSDAVARMTSSLLDTIVILFSLDEAQSLLGNWTAHLTGAYNILELGGSIGEWTRHPRMVVQVALLTWWDAVISLVSRQPCVFPYQYFQSVLACRDDRCWTYFGLCGCPQSLVVPLVQLAHLAADKQKSASMHWATFDGSSLVSEIEESLETWSHTPSSVAFEDEEKMHQDMDCMHCSEAWRNGLLLYIYRVFWWEPGHAIPIKVAHRARAILDHACACRDDGFVARQALLPLFFAGSELADLSSRDKIRNFCSFWNDRTRYHMFGSMIPLLEKVWKVQETCGPENAWWGQIIDEQCPDQPQHPLQLRICFG